MKGYKSETCAVLCQYKFDVKILKDDREERKTKFKQKKISGVQLGQTQ